MCTRDKQPHSRQNGLLPARAHTHNNETLTVVGVVDAAAAHPALRVRLRVVGVVAVLFAQARRDLDAAGHRVGVGAQAVFGRLGGVNHPV